jgi:hypothetical protein
VGAESHSNFRERFQLPICRRNIRFYVCENLFVHIKLHFQTSSGLTPGTFFRRHRSFAGKKHSLGMLKWQSSTLQNSLLQNPPEPNKLQDPQRGCRGCYSSLSIMLRDSATYLHFQRRFRSKKHRDLPFASKSGRQSFDEEIRCCKSTSACPTSFCIQQLSSTKSFDYVSCFTSKQPGSSVDRPPLASRILLFTQKKTGKLS